MTRTAVSAADSKSVRKRNDGFDSRVTHMSKTKTLRTRVYLCVIDNPGLSASEIAKKLGALSSSVSAILYVLQKNKVLVRSPGTGPRGGNTYKVRRILPLPPTRFERILSPGAKEPLT